MAATEAGTRAARALDDLYRRHVGEVYRYAYAVLGNHADAEDVTQTTFVNALRALERGERPREPSHWLIVIAHNIVRQRFRRQQARPAEVELDRDVADGEPDESDDPSLDELVRALQRIPSAQREALVMRELEGRPYKEIAAILDISAGALETLLFRARRSLAEELENLVTCDRAELAMSRQLDSRLSRKERRRLDEHLRECPQCARLQANQQRHRRAWKGLAVLPLPLTLTLFKGAPSASAAAGLPTIGAAAAGGGVAAAGGVTAGGGAAAGGLALGGVALKVAAVVTAVTVAGGVGYEGVKQVQQHRATTKPATAKIKPRQVAVDRTRAEQAARQPGKAQGIQTQGQGSTRASSPTGAVRGATAPGHATSAAVNKGQRGAERRHDPTVDGGKSQRPEVAVKSHKPKAAAVRGRSAAAKSEANGQQKRADPEAAPASAPKQNQNQNQKPPAPPAKGSDTPPPAKGRDSTPAKGQDAGPAATEPAPADSATATSGAGKGSAKTGTPTP